MKLSRGEESPLGNAAAKDGEGREGSTPVSSIQITTKSDEEAAELAHATGPFC